jgi:hypothetical protein
MAKTESPNVDRLREAGIITSKRLSPEQVAAIESLSRKQVDQLIAVNYELKQEVSASTPIIVMPGRIAAKVAKAGKPAKSAKPAKPGKAAKR